MPTPEQWQRACEKSQARANARRTIPVSHAADYVRFALSGLALVAAVVFVVLYGAGVFG